MSATQNRLVLPRSNKSTLHYLNSDDLEFIHLKTCGAHHSRILKGSCTCTDVPRTSVNAVRIDGRTFTLNVPMRVYTTDEDASYWWQTVRDENVMVSIPRHLVIFGDMFVTLFRSDGPEAATENWALEYRPGRVAHLFTFITDNFDETDAIKKLRIVLLRNFDESPDLVEETLRIVQDGDKTKISIFGWFKLSSMRMDAKSVFKMDVAHWPNTEKGK